MSDEIYTKFEARVTVEGPFSSDATIYDPQSLLELALQHALVSMPAEAVTKLVADVTTSMLHSLSCKRRRAGEMVRLEDQDPDGYNGLYLIAVGRGDPTDCVRCGNRLCNEWPTLLELSPAGAQTGDYAYHVSECQMLDPQIAESAPTSTDLPVPMIELSKVEQMAAYYEAPKGFFDWIDTMRNHTSS